MTKRTLEQLEADLYTAWYQIARAIAQLQSDTFAERDVNRYEPIIKAVTTQLGAYLETTDYEQNTVD